jgi:DNA-directed RNA polymerase subunit beta
MLVLTSSALLRVPYRKVEKGRVTDQVEFLSADKEERYIIAQANAPLQDDGRFRNPLGLRTSSW